MYLTEEILDKLNAGNKTSGRNLQADPNDQITLPDIMVRSFAEVKALAGDALTWGETNFLYQQAQQELKENKMAESRILSRSNPQLANAVRLGIRQSSMQYSYDELFPQRASSFVKPGSVASMFSPAGYLTELYREARNLHPDTSQYHLDKRRPDLASLSLSQSNMDDELSTLSLSNALLLNNIQSKESLSYDDVIEKLATYRQTEATPFHLPYEALRQAILLQDPAFKAFRNNPSVAAKMDTSGLLGISSDLSPELHDILTEEITEANVGALVEKNFGGINLTSFQNATWLAHWYGLTYDETRSLLGLITGADNFTPGMQYYQNDQLMTLVSSGDSLNAVLMKRTVKDNTNNVNYAELIPVANGYLLNLSFSDTRPDFQVLQIKDGDDVFFEYENPNLVPEANEALQLSLDIDTNKLTAAGGLDLLIIRWVSEPGDTGFLSRINFQQSTYPYSTILLKLNKLVRLYKATGIALSDIRTVIDSVNDDLSITDDVLSRLFWVNYYAQHYGVDFSAALVLAGANINQITHSGKDSAFTRLFNTPPLNTQLFSADGTVLDLEPGKSEDTFRLGAIKRALQVDDTGLYTLYTLTFTDKDSEGKTIDFTTTINNLSALYRTRLLAEVNQLTVTELSLLLSVSPYTSQKLDTLTDDKLNGLSSAIDRYRQWLNEMNWTVSDLYLMLTDSYSKVLSPDIKNLIDTLKNGLSNLPSSSDEAELIHAVAPFIAAAIQLDSAETAIAILQWLNQLKPKGLTVTDFLGLVDNNSRTDQQTVQLVSFCQVMGQLALVVRNTGLSASELSWAVGHPEIFTEKDTVLGQDIDTLCDLTQLHVLLARSGTYASEILTSLSGDASSEKGNLAVDTVSTALTLNEQALRQALAQVSGYDYFYSWIHLRDALQWLDVATTFDITPDDVAKMVALKYNGTQASPYADWVTVSHALQAGLDQRQTARLQTSLDESLSAAVSVYTIKNIAPSWVTDRDKLYSWLLIDNQVSAQIKTTRIAEAIASLQLYVNRALTGQEDGVVNEEKSKAFFISDWDTYNKRYSTWAGVSQLVYYPENYVDPTMRIGQTGMMDEMLQSLSQSQLNNDTVEDGMRIYLNAFDEIANLQTINCYHDNENADSGFTWFVSCSQTEPKKYFWRKVDHSKFIDGKFAANGWSEWRAINCAISPVENNIRPVVYNSRLYIVWIEEKKVSESEGDTVADIEYYLKFTHIRYDGSWISPYSFPLRDKFKSSEETGMYVTEDVRSNTLISIFYDRNSIDTIENISAKGIAYNNDKICELTSELVENLKNDIFHNLETYGEIKACNVIPSAINFEVYIDQDDGASNGKIHLRTAIDSSAVKYIDDEIVEISIKPALSIISDVNISSFTTNDSILVREAYAFGSILFSYNMEEFVDCISVIQKTGNGAQFFVAEQKDNNSALNTSFIMIDDKNFVDRKITKVITTLRDGDAEKDYDVRMERYDRTRVILSIEGLAIFGFLGLIDEEQLIPISKAEFLDEDGVAYELTISLPSDNSNDMVSPRERFDDYFCFFYTPDLSDITISSENEIECTPKLVDGVAGVSKKPTVVDNYINIEFSELKFRLKITDWEEKDNQFTKEIKFLVDVKDMNKSPVKNTIIFEMHKMIQRNYDIISVNVTDDGAQFIESGIYRTRLNTLFARELIKRAVTGIDAVLQRKTQEIQEPKLGEGAYVTLIFAPYNEETYGSSGNFEIFMSDVYVNGDNFILFRGSLNDTKQTSCDFFVPRLNDSTASPQNMYISVCYEKGCVGKLKITKKEDIWCFDSSYQNINEIDGLVGAFGSNRNSEPMDFNGANALYFWEMFYYVPMMVFKRLLQESRFTEATRWLKYIWDPSGYFIGGEAQNYAWNVRPLEEETSWNADPLDSVDPDAVAQADPMHYKVATFMAYLDLLIARGDAAYRQLERDTLNEAKMWYVQALDTLGDEPYLDDSTWWASPRLTDAADTTAETEVQQALMDVRLHITPPEGGTANALTGLFLPEQNEKLAGYWQTLAQRLYNLRHNLSIDGQPLSLSVYATPADPTALLSAAVNSASGGSALPAEVAMPLYRFPVILESARGMVNQLTQFGSTLLGITERQDAAALSELLQTQGSALVLQSIALQQNTIAEIDADRLALEESRSGAQSRLDSFSTLYDEDVSAQERQALVLQTTASSVSAASKLLFMGAAAADMVPNIYGMAVGGARYGALFNATAIGMQIVSDASQITANNISQSEIWRRRRQEWEIQRNNAESDVKQIDAQLDALAVRRKGALLQKTWLETQQSQTQAQMLFLQNKFTSKALYNWLRGKLAAIYYQFYDLTVSRCLMAEKAYQWTLGATTLFIRPGAWQGTYAGLMAGETLMLNLAQMEQSWLQKDEREKEVTRTVCLSEVYAGLSSDAFTLAEQVVTLVTAGNGSAGTDDNGLTVTDGQLQATLKLAELNIGDDYPTSLGKTRRIKQISVTLPALVGPYQDVRAVLSYGGSVVLPRGCTTTAVSHGMNDSGQFQLDFNDSRWLPFEGIPVGDSGTLTLSFPQVDSSQKDLLLSLTDIILHIRYTIVS